MSKEERGEKEERRERRRMREPEEEAIKYLMKCSYPPQKRREEKTKASSLPLSLERFGMREIRRERKKRKKERKEKERKRGFLSLKKSMRSTVTS